MFFFFLDPRRPGAWPSWTAELYLPITSFLKYACTTIFRFSAFSILDVCMYVIEHSPSPKNPSTWGAGPLRCDVCRANGWMLYQRTVHPNPCKCSEKEASSREGKVRSYIKSTASAVGASLRQERNKNKNASSSNAILSSPSSPAL